MDTTTIGTTGTPWREKEKLQWQQQTQVKRSYEHDVVTKIVPLKTLFNVTQYGELHYPGIAQGQERYPLFHLTSKDWLHTKPTILITGGVHGYETSGVHGALLFAQRYAAKYEANFNFIIAPCISPWGYETINRWNPLTIDPNRAFYSNSPAQEAAAIMQSVQNMGIAIFAHFDLHETTDSDELEFRPALAARDGEQYIKEAVPDGFYTVGDTQRDDDALQQAIIASVRQVTHIAPADENNQIIGSDVIMEGVINYPLQQLSLCAGFTGCEYSTTTEVYPDSPKVNADECDQAQVAAIIGALDYLLTLK